MKRTVLLPSKVSANHKTKVTIVAPSVVVKNDGVSEVLIILPDVGKRQLHTSSHVPFDGVVVEQPVEQIIGATEVSKTRRSSLRCDPF